MNKKYICAIRHVKSGIFKNPVIVDDAESYVTEVRAFIHNTPTSAFALFPADYEIVYFFIDMDSRDSKELVSIPLTNFIKGE